MNNDDAYPVIKPHKMKEYEFKQSKYEVAPKIPFSQIVVGPSGSGKTILLQNMVGARHLQRLLHTHLYLLQFRPRGWGMGASEEIHREQPEDRHRERESLL